MIDMQNTHLERIIKQDNDVENKIKLFSRRVTKLATKRKRDRGESLAKQAENMNIQKSNFSKYKESNDYYKDIPRPRADVLLKIANYYDVSIDYLLGITNYEQQIDTEDKEFMRKVCDYTGLSENTIKHLNELIDDRITMLIINYLFDNQGVFNSIIEYYKSSLFVFFAESDYFDLFKNKKQLPKDAQEKLSYAELLDTLPISRRELFNFVYNDHNLKNQIAMSFARENITVESARAKLEHERNNMDCNNYEYKIKLLSEIENDKIPYGENRFSSSQYLNSFNTVFNKVLTDILTSNTSESSECESDDDPYIKLSSEIIEDTINNQ